MNSSYALAWNDYRRRVRWFLGVWLGGFVIAAAVGMVLDHLSTGEWAMIAVGGIWLSSFAIAGFRLQAFRCPRCQQPFFNQRWSYWPFAGACLHCGLPRTQGIEKS
ncbi:hypothetical protein LVB77_14475 [Lysobacter sp. 5GHs7-4]|uniref:hypothetical protein n=1 Tax=Lysobacter sp. 5GHs7-4 TaxID=2904253 RepID=UPI001E3BB3DC|nr:hypothetical protein [Lysobacter sp. 5GHs7-4]UHQ21871.1 hypothetical protein LVB77_14475 [Lysobacter sp. 5GHs7-4]